MIIFDTDTLTHFSYRNDSVRRKFELACASNPEEEIAITIITRYEILRGRMENLLKADDRAKRTMAMD